MIDAKNLFDRIRKIKGAPLTQAEVDAVNEVIEPLAPAKAKGTVALDGNNPGGINDGDFSKAQPGYAGPNGRYASFKTLTDGVNAMKKLLTSYITRGYDTPREIANRWAPSADGNDSAAYAQRIAAGLGIGLDTKIDVKDAMALTLVQARIENVNFPAKWAAAQKVA